jgi:hypothetical protein
MVEGLIIILVFCFITLIIGIIKQLLIVIIPQIVAIALILYLLIRVRVKISKAEKEKLRAKIDELEMKIGSISEKQLK